MYKFAHWPTQSVGNLFYVKGRIGWRGLKRKDFCNEGPYLITGMHIADSGDVDWAACFRIPQRRYDESPEIVVSPDDLVITKDGTIGKVAYIDFLPGPTSLNSHLFLVRPKDPAAIRQRFAFHIFRSPAFQEFIEQQKSGSTLAGLGESKFLRFQVPTPDLEEQQRFTEVLDTLDTTIRQTEAIIEKLKQVKQGLLHDLLTRGIDANGELRPPQSQAPHLYEESPLGWIPRDWEAVPVSELAENLDGRRLPIKETERRPGIYPYYGASGIIDWVESYILDGDYVLLGEDGENVVSRNLPLAFRVTGKIWVNNHAHIYEPRRDVDVRFLVEVLEAKDYGPWVSGSAQPKLTQDALARIRFQRPPPPEQVMIADRLEGVASRIAAESGEVVKLRALKSGLMDDLLTGRVRVTPLLDAATRS